MRAVLENEKTKTENFVCQTFPQTFDTAPQECSMLLIRSLDASSVLKISFGDPVYVISVNGSVNDNGMQQFKLESEKLDRDSQELRREAQFQSSQKISLPCTFERAYVFASQSRSFLLRSDPLEYHAPSC